MKKSERSAYERELAKAVHAHNEKIRYHEAKGARHLPERQSFAELKNILTTKKDFEKTISEVREFGKKGAEKPVKVSESLTITAWEKKTIEAETASVNRSRAARKAHFDKLEVRNSGKKTGYKRGEQSTQRGAEYRKKKLNWENIRSRSELKALTNTLKYQTTEKYWNDRNERWRMNYIQSIYNTYGAKANGLIKKISNMPLDQFVKTMNSDQNATVTFQYETLDSDVKLDALTLIWTGEETGDTDLTEFFEI